ncbi:MAG TPA: hypothetical protein VFC78_02005 [Tepidisphaeraceae bacterium]|nr:hypothetical protein [Tepidisphaeraceae bacterium]
MDIDKARQQIDAWFPALAAQGYRITSSADVSYNCISWAVGETNRRWDIAPGYYWPIKPRARAAQSLIFAFESVGFKILRELDSDTASNLAAITPEPGIEKVAIYVIGKNWTHAARTLENGKWTSKLGDYEDIEHETLEGFEMFYGKAKYIMAKTKVPAAAVSG